MVFDMSGELVGARFVVFYVSGRLWGAEFVVFYVSGRLSQVLGELGGSNLSVLRHFGSEVFKNQ